MQAQADLSQRQSAIISASRILVDAIGELLGVEPPKARLYTARDRAEMAAEVFCYVARVHEMTAVHDLLKVMREREQRPGGEIHRQAVAAYAIAKQAVESPEVRA